MISGMYYGWYLSDWSISENFQPEWDLKITNYWKLGVRPRPDDSSFGKSVGLAIPRLWVQIPLQPKFSDFDQSLKYHL